MPVVSCWSRRGKAGRRVAARHISGAQTADSVAQLIGQAGQLVTGFSAADRLLNGAFGDVANLHHALGDGIGHLTLLFHGRRNFAVALADLTDSGGNFVQLFTRVGYLVDGRVGQPCAGLHVFHRDGCTALQCFDHALNVIGRRLHPLCQRTDLVGDYRKAAA